VFSAVPGICHVQPSVAAGARGAGEAAERIDDRAAEDVRRCPAVVRAGGGVGQPAANGQGAPIPPTWRWPPLAVLTPLLAVTLPPFQIVAKSDGLGGPAGGPTVGSVSQLFGS
jgi:hypothetical protein